MTRPDAGWPAEPSWEDAYRLVRDLVAAGYQTASVELPGLRLSLSASPSASPSAAPEPEEAGLFTVAAPVTGVFYRRPAPEAQPFVRPGDEVRPETVVAIVEVMKLMVSVEAGAVGRVARICVEDGDDVTEGQTLALLAPAPNGHAAARTAA